MLAFDLWYKSRVTFYQNLADIVLILHTLFVVFIITILLLTVIGGYRQWKWIRNWWLRVCHLIGIVFVVIQSWAGLVCPLTTLEAWLRSHNGGAQYEGSFIQYWLERFLYFSASEWIFIVVYTVFGLLVILTWVRFPPQKNPSTGRYVASEERHDKETDTDNSA
ncbi:MAG: hypothetical protein COA74_10800 [Gammaproteobacteria bacterium]|nr:MAG: hypothetical protein COA74_10800 [Gammaproteobacteria bacterium]